VRDALAELDWLGWVLGDVTLVASELVANAVTHSGALPSDTLTVQADLAPDHLRIAVRDPGRSGEVPHIRASQAPSDGGWGLLIVEQLSLRWGVERDSGNIVWAEVALPVTDEQDVA
jgi:anti-sigma regulatory factor (Ser/Thr protein kinase)